MPEQKRPKRWLVSLAAAAVLAAAGGGLWAVLGRGGDVDAAYRVGPVDRGDIVASVRATGTLNPLTNVLVGSQLSGQIVEILADYNSTVKQGQVVARLFSEQVRARRDAAAANLSDLRAQLDQRHAQLDKARATRVKADATLQDLAAQRDRAAAQAADAGRTHDRQRSLFQRGTGAEQAYDTARTQLAVQNATVASVTAQIAAATADLSGLDADIALARGQVESMKAQITAGEAQLQVAEIDLDHTEIRSPVNGVVVQRQVDLGQTVAASLSTPTLFTIAQDLHDIDIWANVDESDVGRVKEGQLVKFTVNAYPNRTYEGLVRQIRLAAQTISNVVTYTTVVRVANSDLTLLPGMTANLQIIADERQNVLRIPNAALRFRPPGAAGPAAGAPSAPAAAPAGERSGGRVLAQIREEIVTELKPTPTQVQAVDEAIAEVRTSPTVRDPALTQEERRAAFQALRQAMVQRISTSLDPERRKAFEAMVQRAQAARAQGHGGTGRVWILDPAGGEPKPVSVRLGIADGSFTEVVRGDLKDGDSVIIGGGGRLAVSPPTRPTPMGGPRGPRLF